MVPAMRNIRAILESFTKQLTAIIEASVLERARAKMLTAFGDSDFVSRRGGRPPKALGDITRPRKKAPVQLCPVPGCKNPAAPIFGMVCSKHKDLPKAKIKKYREARRLAKLKGTSKAAPKRRGKRVARRPKQVARPKKTVRRNVKARKATANPVAAAAPASRAVSTPAEATT
jgi:hypothetical protein